MTLQGCRTGYGGFDACGEISILAATGRSLTEEDLNRALGLIASMGHARPQDTLYALARKGYVEKSYIHAWASLRNRHVHPKPRDLKALDLADRQRLLDRIHRAEMLLRQLTFHLIQYESFGLVSRASNC